LSGSGRVRNSTFRTHGFSSRSISASWRTNTRAGVRHKDCIVKGRFFRLLRGSTVHEVGIAHVIPAPAPIVAQPLLPAWFYVVREGFPDLRFSQVGHCRCSFRVAFRLSFRLINLRPVAGSSDQCQMIRQPSEFELQGFRGLLKWSVFDKQCLTRCQLLSEINGVSRKYRVVS
jgi:hypothetical protein